MGKAGGEPGGTEMGARAVGAGKASMSKGQLAYERRRAAEAGLSLEAWLKRKAREAEAAAPRAAAAAPPRKGLIGRLLDKAHRPL